MLDLREEFCPPGFWTSEKIFIPPELSRNNYLSESLLSPHMLGYQRNSGKSMILFNKFVLSTRGTIEILEREIKLPLDFGSE